MTTIDRAHRGSPLESVWLYALAGALMTGGPVWHYLFVNRYPFDRPEAVFLPLAAGLLGAGIAVVGRRLGGLLASLSFGALLYVFVDLQLNLEQSVRTLLVALGCVVLAHLLRSRRALLICLMLGTFNLASLPRRGGTPAPPREAAGIRRPDSLPVLVHIVLDEQWGIGGLRAAGDQATAQFLTAFYLERGFEVYEGAYSRWAQTVTSIADMMSLGRPVKTQPVPPDAKFPDRFRLLGNPYFERLLTMGYSIDVYGPTYVDYCRARAVPVAACRTVPGNSIANLGALGGAWTERAWLAGQYFLSVTSHAYRRLGGRDAEVRRRASAGGGLAQLAEVRDALADGVGATAILVHVLVPHRPLELEADCRVRADPTQRIGYDLPVPLSDSAWNALMALYADQVRCAHLAVGSVLDALDRTVGREQAIVIVQGDHGSGLHPDDETPAGRGTTPASTWDAERLNSAYSTLFAIRRPGVPGAVHREALPIQDFFWRLIRNDFRHGSDTTWEHYVRVHLTDSLPAAADNIRALAPAEMLWASFPRENARERKPR